MMGTATVRLNAGGVTHDDIVCQDERGAQPRRIPCPLLLTDELFTSSPGSPHSLQAAHRCIVLRKTGLLRPAGWLSCKGC